MRLYFDKQRLPHGWIMDRIGNRIKLNYGKSQAYIRSVDGHIPIYGTGGLMEFGTDWLSEGDSVLIGRKGTLDDPIYIDHPFWPVDTTYYTSDFDGSTKWFYYLVQALDLATLNEATGVPSLARDTFYKLEIPFPPKPEQSKIAEVLTLVDRAIEQTEALIAKYQRIKTGLMQDLLTRGIDEHGQLRDPATHQFKPSPLGMIPVEWEVQPLSELAEINSGVTLGRRISGPDTVELPYLRVANVQDGYLDLSEIKTIRVYKSELPRFLLQAGDVLMNEGGDYDKLGRGTVWYGQIAPCLHQNHVFRVRPDQSLLVPEFLAVVSSSVYGKKFFVLSSKQSTNLASINSTQLKAFPIPCPSTTEQQRIVFVSSKLDEVVQIEEAYLSKLKLLKTGLMQDLLTGKVSVEPLL